MIELLRHRTSLLAFAACLLAACGGGSGGNAAASQDSGNTPSAVQPAPPAPDSDTPAPVDPQSPSTPRAGSIALAWIAPLVNADGSPLTDLSGYRVRYGTYSGIYSAMQQIDDPHTVNIVLKDLPANTYYLTVTAYNSANVESLASAEVSKSIE
jgi:hypothetical protein